MRLIQPIEFEIPNFLSKSWSLKEGVRLHLDIHPPKGTEIFDYWKEKTVVTVDVIRRRTGHSEERKTIHFPERLNAFSVPKTIFDAGAFIDELNCDIGLLFASLCAPKARIEAKLIKDKSLARIRLFITDSYSSETTLPLDELKPFFRKRH